MTLGTYPLSSLARHWTERSNLQANDRVFSSDGSEGLYNALRLLLNAHHDQPPKRCQVQEPKKIIQDDAGLFLPPVVCSSEHTMPVDDYARPQWIQSTSCENLPDQSVCYSAPLVWLSVIGVNRFWPLVSLDDKAALAESHPDPNNAPTQGILGPPLVMKLCLLVFLAFSFFHLFCCARGSYMAKPCFRAYFAPSGDPRQITLIWFGSSLVAFLGSSPPGAAAFLRCLPSQCRVPG